MLQAPADAVACYAQSIDLLLAADDVMRATDAAHGLETLAARPTVPDELRTQLSAQARQHAGRVARREYQTRYSHPP